MKYVIKFCIPGDEVKVFHPDNSIELEEHTPEVLNFSKVEGKTMFLNAISCNIIELNIIFSMKFIFMFSSYL